jgi:ABC-type uncharacterized transport system involved in gliding motility auxiliary subunit
MAMKQKTQNLLQQIVNGILIVAVIGLLGFLSVRYEVKQDWTANKRNTLTAGSQKLLGSMDKPIKFVAFVYPGSEDRAGVESFVELYQRFKKDIEIEFVDPTSQPQKVKEYEVSFRGEVVVEYDGRKEHLNTLSEQEITGALQRLSLAGDKWVVFLEGHGERSIVEGTSQNDYMQFAATLKKKGLKIQPLNLLKAQAIPDNTAVLVLASPKSPLLPGEIKLVQDYVDKGGSLLWLSDTDDQDGLDGLAASFGVKWQKGIGIFPFEFKMLGTESPVIYMAMEYPPNPVTKGIDQPAWLPIVHSIATVPGKDFRAAPLLTANEAAWLETQPLTENVSLDQKAGDIPGPLTLAMTLTRNVKDAAEPAPVQKDGAPPTPDEPAKTRQQRIALVGDADFLADANLHAYANEALGVNLVQWLALRDSQLNVDVPKAPDTSLFLSDVQLAMIWLVFPVLIPALLLGFGVTRWSIRRRR